MNQTLEEIRVETVLLKEELEDWIGAKPAIPEEVLLVRSEKIDPYEERLRVLEEIQVEEKALSEINFEGLLCPLLNAEEMSEWLAHVEAYELD